MRAERPLLAEVAYPHLHFKMLSTLKEDVLSNEERHQALDWDQMHR